VNPTSVPTNAVVNGPAPNKYANINNYLNNNNNNNNNLNKVPSSYDLVSPKIPIINANQAVASPIPPSSNLPNNIINSNNNQNGYQNYNQPAYNNPYMKPYPLQPN
jgi:hypothetical protein